jgi:hypothetical protein
MPDETVNLLLGLVVVEISALQWKSDEERPQNVEKYAEFVQIDECHRGTIGLQRLESGLFVDFSGGVECAKNYFIILRQLLDLVVSSQLVAFFKRPRDPR